jgi:predicted acetyltransferase
MSEIVVRPYREEDREGTFHVRAMTYNSGRPIPVDQQVYKTSTPFVGEVDGKIVGTYVVMDMTTTRGGLAEWKTGGIAGVAVLPEARHTGVGGAMMRWALKDLRNRGYILAALYAFRESYYRKFGYEVCGIRHKVTCPNSRLPKRSSDLPVRRIFFKDLDEIKACYEGFARVRSGMNLRNDMHWGRIINDDEVKTVYAVGDPVEAYAIVEHDWAFWKDQPVEELAWTSLRGYDAIVSFLGSIGINKTSVSWYEPSDGLFLTRHLDQGVRIEAEKPVMYRALNVPVALESLASSGSGSFAIGVQDAVLPENDGPWQVCFEGGSSSLSRALTADFELDERSVAQALLGQPSLDDLVRNGIAAGVDAAQRFLPPSPTFCIDYY